MTVGYLTKADFCVVLCRQRIGSIGDMDNLKSNGPDPFDLDRLKQEIMVEIRMEINKLKQDIIDGKLYFCVYIFNIGSTVIYCQSQSENN